MANAYFKTPPVVKNLLIVNILLFLAAVVMPAQAVNAMYDYGALHFWKGGNFHIWQPVTYMFLHAGWAHVLSNMFALWMFGRTIEYQLGSKKFLIYYLICGVGAGLLQLGVNWIEFGAAYNAGEMAAAARLANASTVGASGAVFGILLAFGMLNPNATIVLLFPPIPMKAKWFVIIYGVIELVAGVRGTGGGVAHFAHVGGMLWGFLMLYYWKKKGKIYY